MNITKSRMAAVAAGAVALVAIAGVGGATAGALITSADIKDGTIAKVDLHGSSVTSSKIKDGAVKSVDIADGTIAAGDLAAGVIPAAPSYTKTITLSKAAADTSAALGTLTCDSGTWLDDSTSAWDDTAVSDFDAATDGSADGFAQVWVIDGNGDPISLAAASGSGTDNGTIKFDATYGVVPIGYVLGTVNVASQVGVGPWTVTARISCNG